MTKNKLTKDQRIMFTRIFIGLNREEDKKHGIKAEIVKPSLEYISGQFPELDVEPIATKLWMDLIERGTVFNYTYWKLKLHDKCKREYNKQVTMLKRQTLGLATGDIQTDLNQLEEVDPPEISWKQPLTEDEKLMTECLIAEMGQRAIYNKHGIHPSKQQKLRESIKNKMEII